jgi:FG-GAP repeat
MSTRLERRCAVRWTILGALAAGTAALAGCGGGSNLYSYTAPTAVVIADFNGSGRPGIAVAQTQINQLNATEQAGYVAVALQKTSTPGAFESAAHFATQGNPSAMAAGALTPGTVDLVVGNVNDGTVSVLMQSSPNTVSYQSAVNLKVAPAGVSGTVLPEDVAICDVNGDGHPDIVVAYVLEQDQQGVLASVGGGVSLIAQDPSNPGHFLAAQAVGSTPTGSGASYANAAYGIACANLSGSTTAPPDIVMVSTYQYDQSGDFGTVSIFAHDPSSPGSFLPRADISVPGELHRVVVADLNGDGLPDIAVGSESADLNNLGQAGVVVLLQQTPAAGAKEPTFATPVPYASNSAIALAVGDVNGDGLQDIVTVTPGANSVSGTGAVNVLLNTPSSPGTFQSPVVYSAISNPVAVALGELSGKPLPDIAIADGGGAAVLLNSSSNPGTFGAVLLAAQ